MNFGATYLLAGLLLSLSLILISSKTLPSHTDRQFPVLGRKVNDTLECYRRAKGFPVTPLKGALSRVIGLAPTDVNSWKLKSKIDRYSMCLSALKGFQSPLSTIIKTDKDSTFYCHTPGPKKLSQKLYDLSKRLNTTMDALAYFVVDILKLDIKLSGVKTFDMDMALRTARKVAETWPPVTKEEPRGTTNPQFLVNYVVLEQLSDTVQSFRHNNICPVPLI